jgi:hypothetical protein
MDLKITGQEAEVSDGYHTFSELYDHRITLWIALCRMYAFEDAPSWAEKLVWRSKLHSDGSCFDGWFVLGIGVKPGEQMTYHLPLSMWDETGFAKTSDRAPEFDGHSSADVLARIKTIL